MKKTIIAFALLAFTGCSSAETNDPVIMKGIYGNRSRSAQTESPRSNHNVITFALRRFVEIQNPDGSWGAEGAKQLSTAFCLISFLRHGETSHSEKFGKPITNAHVWLMDSQPKSDPERIATAIALSDYITVHFRWHDPDEKADVPADQIQKVRDCFNAISPQCGEMWRDLITLSRLPKEISRRLDGDTIRATLDKYLDREPDGPPSRLDDYLILHLCSSARFHRGGNKWSDWNRQFAPMMVRIQASDGLFPCNPAEDNISATGLSVMSLTSYYIFSPNFSARAWSAKHKAEDEEIKIDFK